jgi:hypothetical protein
MASSVRRLRLVLAIAVALCLAAPLAASAATTRYASPTGAGPSPCLQSAPCSIETALSNAGPEGLANGDTVLLAPGTYEPVAELDVLRVGVTVAGEPGEPAPLIEVAGTRGFNLENEGVARDLRIHSSAATNFAFVASRTGSVVERVESTGEAMVACGLGSVTVRDTLCAASTPNSEGIRTSISGSLGSGYEPLLYNVTAIGGRIGIDAFANEASVVTIKAFNTIVRGGEFDIEARSAAPLESHVEVALAHSNFATVEAIGGAEVSEPTANGNQTAPPIFVDEAGFDYREAASSPTRLAGDLGAVLPGEVDLAGNPRTTTCAGTVGVDIGAYQYECPTPEPPPEPPARTLPLPPGPPPPAAPVAPQLSKLALKPKKFTDTGKAPKGTTVSFTLSATASVKLEVLGKKTVKSKKKTVTLGTLPVVSGKAGANSVKFSGKLKGKPLEPGKYTLRATATASGLSSATATAGFEVLIP